MKQKFGVLLLGEVWELLDTLDEKTKDKIFYNMSTLRKVKILIFNLFNPQPPKGGG
jgi:hypothetical protein